MAVLSVNERLPREPAADDERGRRHARVFIVEVDAVGDGPLTVLGATGVPPLGEVHPEDAYMLCRTRTCQAIDSEPYWFEVVCNYDTNTRFVGFNASDTVNVQINSPEFRPTRYRFGGSQSTVSITETASGYDGAREPFLNPLGEPVGPLTIARTNRVFTATKWLPVNGSDLALAQEQYVDKVNSADSAEFNNNMHVTKHMARLVSLDCESQFEAGFMYWVCTYQFEIRKGPPTKNLVTTEGVPVTAGNPSGWQPQARVQSTQFREDGQNRPIIRDGLPISEKIDLVLADDGSGDWVPRDNYGGDPVYQQFNTYEEANFDDLALF